jgi:endoglucanase
MSMTTRPIALAGCFAFVLSCGDGAGASIDSNSDADARVASSADAPIGGTPDARPGSMADAPTGTTATGLHVVRGAGGAAGHLVDADGHMVLLRGANRAGTEYACLYGNVFDGPSDQASITAMKSWHINAVRVPMNEDCWLGLNGVPAASSGASYRDAIRAYVSLL